jgi:hypothetical protein
MKRGGGRNLQGRLDALDHPSVFGDIIGGNPTQDSSRSNDRPCLGINDHSPAGGITGIAPGRAIGLNH